MQGSRRGEAHEIAWLTCFFYPCGENKFYEHQRNAYPDVSAESIFARNTLAFRILRRGIGSIRDELLRGLFGNWKFNLSQYDVVILPVSIYSKAIANYIQARSDIHIAHWYWNPVSTTVHPRELLGGRSAIYAFDENDCATHGLRYRRTYYFKNIPLPRSSIAYDVCFVGADKGRLTRLLQLQGALRAMGLKVAFHITGSDTKKPSRSYAYQGRIGYEEILQYISRSKAILDLVQDGQVGLTQRPMEALFFRKKLITNDKGILKADFYCRDNIFILGHDELDRMTEFLYSPFTPVSDEIREQYDFGHWVDSIVADFLPSSSALHQQSVGAAAARSYSPRGASYWAVFAIICVLVGGGNLDNPDRDAYEQNYYDLRDGGVSLRFEPGYQFFASIFSNLGAPYELFTFVTAIVAMTLIASTVRMFTDRPTAVLLMYAAYPMFWDSVQVRNLMAMAVLIYAARYIISPVKRIRRFALFVLVAATLHVTSLFYLVFTLMAIRRTCDFLIMSIFAFLVYAYGLTILLESPLSGIVLHKVESYTTTETSLTTKVAVVSFYLASLALIYVTHRIIRACQVQARFVPDHQMRGASNPGACDSSRGRPFDVIANR